MKIITAGVTSAMLAAGVAGSVAAYRTQAASADVTRPAAEVTSGDSAGRTPRTAGDPDPSPVRWAPCPAGSTLEEGTCVTEVVHTVVLAPASPTTAALTTPQAAAASQAGDDSDQADAETKADPRGDDDGDDSDESDDHGDDDHGDDDHGDDDHEDDDHEDDDHEDDDHEDDDED